MGPQVFADMLEKEIAMVREALRELVRASGSTLRCIQATIGKSESYLTQVLRGRIALRLWHVIAICRVLGLEPVEFLARVYAACPTSADTEAALMRRQVTGAAEVRAGRPTPEAAVAGASPKRAPTKRPIATIQAQEPGEHLVRPHQMSASSRGPRGAEGERVPWRAEVRDIERAVLRRPSSATAGMSRRRHERWA